MAAYKYNLCIVQPHVGVVSETFIRAHAQRLPANTTVVHSTKGNVPMIGECPVLDQGLVSRGARKLQRWWYHRDWSWQSTQAYLAAINKTRAHAVLAEYGPSAVALLDACKISKVPLIAHFHGYDASKTEVVERLKDDYLRLFREAAAIVVVSREMEEALVAFGASPGCTHRIVYGVDCNLFRPRAQKPDRPVFVAVGRFVEKKGPHLTLLALAGVVKNCPEVRLRMIGDGPLLGVCYDLSVALGVAGQVEFLGAQPQERVAWELSHCSAFVQHSIRASDGDCEGTPVAVLEASASGVPVIATRHGGIEDVVIDGATGMLVREKDVNGMAAAMMKIIDDPSLAARLGETGRKRVSSLFNMEKSISSLWQVIEASVHNGLSSQRRSNG